MGVYTEVIGQISLGTATGKTQLSGNHTTTATSWILPADCKGIISVTPILNLVTPTATEASVASLKVESSDLGTPDYEVLATPLGGSVATTDLGLAEQPQPDGLYPMYWRSNGGEAVDFFGIPQTSNTAAPYMGVSVRWTDSVEEINKQAPFKAKIGGAAGGAGSGTSTGTTANTNVTGATLTLNGGVKRIKTVTGIVTSPSPTTVKPITGWFSWTANEMKYPLRYQCNPVPASLGTAQQMNFLTRYDVDCEVRTPSTLQGGFNVVAAPSTAGNFYQGIVYQG
jgi:hypothetical protein